MGGKKRPRTCIDDADCKRKKQLKIMDFTSDCVLEKELQAFPVSNKFSPLESSANEAAVFEFPSDPLPLTQTKNREKETPHCAGRQDLRPRGIQTTLLSPGCEDDKISDYELLCRQTNLIAETILNMYSKLDDINIKLEKICLAQKQLLAWPQQSVKKAESLPYAKDGYKSPLNSGKPGTDLVDVLSSGLELARPSNTKVNVSKSLPRSSLRLQMRKVALLIGNCRANYMNWDNKFLVERSLAQLLRRRKQDLQIANISWLPKGAFLKRLLITFQNEDIPSELLRSHALLWKFHITATRAFEDSNMRHIRLKKPVQSSQQSQQPLIQLDESAGGSDLSDVLVTLGPASKTIVKAHVHIPTSGPAHMLLPPKAGPCESLFRVEDSDTTLKRTDVLMTETPSSRLNCQDSKTRNSSLSPRKSFSTSDFCKDTLGLLISSVKDHQRPEHIMPTTEPGQITPISGPLSNTSPRSNGCVFIDHQKALEQILDLN